MRVRYVPNAGPEKYPELGERSDYVVLEICVDKDGAKYRILVEEGSITPTLYPANLFDLVSSQIPSSWVVSTGRARGFYLVIAPSRWVVPGFWENYFDREASAVKIFEEEKQRIFLEEH